MSQYMNRIETGHPDGRKLGPQKVGKAVIEAFKESGELTLCIKQGPDLGGGQNLTIYTPRESGKTL